MTFRQDARSPKEELVALIELMDEEQAERALTAIKDAQAETDAAALYEAFRDDPDIILPDNPRPRFRKVTPVKITGRPLSQDVIEDRR